MKLKIVSIIAILFALFGVGTAKATVSPILACQEKQDAIDIARKVYDRSTYENIGDEYISDGKCGVVLLSFPLKRSPEMITRIAGVVPVSNGTDTYYAILVLRGLNV